MENLPERRPAESPLAPLKRKLAARTELAELKRLERIAQQYERLAKRPDVESDFVVRLMQRVRSQYSTYAGVHLEQRHTYRNILLEVAETGSREIREIRRALRRDYYINGFAPDGGEGDLPS